MEVGGKIDSDHKSLTVWLKRRIREVIRDERGKEKKWEMKHLQKKDKKHKKVSLTYSVRSHGSDLIRGCDANKKTKRE